LVAIATEDENLLGTQIRRSKRVCHRLHREVHVSLLLYSFLAPRVLISLIVITLVKAVDDEQVADRAKCAPPQ
jgi:hypothetical protein